MPACFIAPSVTIQSLSDLFGIVMVFVSFKLSFAVLKLVRVDSVQVSFSDDGLPLVRAFNGLMMWLLPLITLAKAL